MDLMWILMSLYLFISLWLPVAMATHFRGGVIHWKTLVDISPGDDIRIMLTYRMAWRKDHSDETFCDEETISSRTLTGPRGNLDCQLGCDGMLDILLADLRYYCTDYSTSVTEGRHPLTLGQDWSVGENSVGVAIQSDVPEFVAAYRDGEWPELVLGGMEWEFRVTANFSAVTSAGRKQNSSPQSKMSPIVRIKQGCSEVIMIPIMDADSDVVRCRWAEEELWECGDVCHGLPDADLDTSTCIIWSSSYAGEGLYVVALQIEDFADDKSTIPMSSIPLQFMVEVYKHEGFCEEGALFGGVTPSDDACIAIPPGTTFHQSIHAQSPDGGSDVIQISTQSPLGMKISSLEYHVINRRKFALRNSTWTPEESQYGPHIFCFTAYDKNFISSQQRCVTLLAGVKAPIAIQVSKLGPNTTVLDIKFDQDIKKPNENARVTVQTAAAEHVFEILDEFLVTFPKEDKSVMRITRNLPSIQEDQPYSVLIDEGVVRSTLYCGSPNKASVHIFNSKSGGESSMLITHPKTEPTTIDNGLSTTDSQRENRHSKTTRTDVSSWPSHLSSKIETSSEPIKHYISTTYTPVNTSAVISFDDVGTSETNLRTESEGLFSTQLTKDLNSGTTVLDESIPDQDPCADPNSLRCLSTTWCMDKCSDNGVCAMDWDGLYRCFCDEGWRGMDCSRSITTTPRGLDIECTGRGVWLSIPDSHSGKCICIEGFSGNDCSLTLSTTILSSSTTLGSIPTEISLEESKLTADITCSGFGTWLPVQNGRLGICQCDIGYSGPNCGVSNTTPLTPTTCVPTLSPAGSQPDCPNNCHSNGICSWMVVSNTVQSICNCHTNFHGEDCSLDLSQSKPLLYGSISGGTPNKELNVLLTAHMAAYTSHALVRIYIIDIIPEGSKFSKGRGIGKYMWMLEREDFGHVMLTLPDGYTGEVRFKVIAVASWAGVQTESDMLLNTKVENAPCNVAQVQRITRETPNKSNNAFEHKIKSCIHYPMYLITVFIIIFNL